MLVPLSRGARSRRDDLDETGFERDPFQVVTGLGRVRRLSPLAHVPDAADGTDVVVVALATPGGDAES